MMTNIAIVASGSRGDVQPYIALGQGLSRAGYSVRVLTNDNFEPLITSAGLAFCSLGENIEELVQSEEWRSTIESGNFLKILARMRTETRKRAGNAAKLMPPLLEGSDLIVTGMAGLGSVYAIAEKLKIPVVQAYVFPFTPTRAFPAPLVPAGSLGGVLNKLSFHALHQIFWQSARDEDVATRKTLGLPNGPTWGPYRELSRQQVPALYGYSTHVLPRPADWPAQHQVTGYWFVEEAPGWMPPPDLLAFLNAGKPPVYIGFGSMGSRNPQEAGRIALEALALSGQRGVLASGWGGLQAADLPPSVHLISAIPHGWLFPRMAAVVHHCGAGTTAAGLRAGVPTIPVPFMGDQPFWGNRLARLGVGTAPIPRKRLTSQRLADAIREATTNTMMQTQARELGQLVRAEDGLGKAVACVQRFVEGRKQT